MISPIIHRFDEVGSTNDIALDMARSGAPEGTAVVARSQSHGRGRRGRQWVAQPGENVFLSVILRPDVPLNRYSELSFVAAVAVARLIQGCGLTPSVKWPNDVRVHDRKIAGILVEAAEGAAVVGIGVNVQQTEFPEEIADTATSIAREGGSCTDVESATQSLLTQLFAVYELPFEEILTQWRKYMWGVGRSVEVITEAGTVSGAIVGVDSDGALLVHSNGALTKIVAADAIRTLNP